MTSPSPIGRYDGEAVAEEAMHEVVLLNIPVRVYAAARDRHDELMREFARLALGGPSGRPDVPARLLELIEILGVRYGVATARPDEAVDAALARGDDTMDVRYTVPARVVDAAAALEGLMTEADEYCASEQLLTMARDPTQKALADWYLGEFRRQVGGEPPLPWDGPLDASG